MFGVVLWSDPGVNKAVIWCEDHGDLAYLNGTQFNAGNCVPDHEFLDAGDYVQFDLTVEDDVRRVRNAKIVHVASFAKLPKALPPSPKLSHSHSKLSSDRQPAEVISFDEITRKRASVLQR